MSSVYRSVNGGNWSDVGNGLPEYNEDWEFDYNYTELGFPPGQPDRIYLGMYTEDGGHPLEGLWGATPHPGGPAKGELGTYRIPTPHKNFHDFGFFHMEKIFWYIPDFFHVEKVSDRDNKV